MGDTGFEFPIIVPLNAGCNFINENSLQQNYANQKANQNSCGVKSVANNCNSNLSIADQFFLQAIETALPNLSFATKMQILQLIEPANNPSVQKSDLVEVF
jgi:hypothetical protein